MSMTLEQAKALRHGDVLHSDAYINSDETCQRWRVSGKVKTWKRNPGKVCVLLKHGLNTHDYLTDEWLYCFHLEGECMREKHKLMIDSYHDGMMHCSCGEWSLSCTGRMTKEHARINHEAHIRGVIVVLKAK